MLNEVYLGLGSNLENPASNIAEGLRLLTTDAISLQTSSLYRTSPQGFSSQPTFFNAACRFWTRLDPFQLMARLLKIEAAVGRQRIFKNAPRILDMDILIYSTMAFTSPILTIPHPLMAQRSFVLMPLAEIAPQLRHPIQGETMRALLAELPRDKEAITKLPMITWRMLNS